MTTGVSAQLQEFIYTLLKEDTELAAAVEGHIFDAPPPGPLPASYITLGPEKVSDASDMTVRASLHEVAISVITTETGFVSIKNIAGMVTALLDDQCADLEDGFLSALRFQRSEAARESDGTIRRVDLVFRARIDAH